MVSDSSFVGQYVLDGSFVQGLIVEILGGLLFLWVILYLLRPKIEISPVIAKYQTVERGTQETKFSIKVINRSMYDAFEVVAQLYYYEHIQAQPSGHHKKLYEIKLAKEVNPHLSGNRWYILLPFVGDKLSRTYVKESANFAVWFSTFEDIEAILNRNNVVGSNPSVSLEFKVILKHGLTGLANSEEMSYSSSNVIINGKYELGNSFKIS